MGVYLQPGSPNYLCEFVFQGQRIRRSTGTPKKREAEQFERDLRREMKERAAGGFVKMTLAEAVQRYAETVVKLGRTDSANYISKVNRVLGYFGPNALLEEITTAKITAWRDGMLKGVRIIDGRNGKGVVRPMKPGSVNAFLQVLRAILRKAHLEWKSLPVLPLVKLLKDPNSKRVRFLTDDEERALLARCPEHLRDLVTFLIGTGARKSEAMTLPWDNVNDLRSNRRASVYFEHSPEKGLVTKNGQSRRVPITNALRDGLLAIRDRQRKGGYTGGDVFAYKLRRQAEWTRLKGVQGAFDKARAAAKLKNVSLHTLRHTYASRLVSMGVPLLNVRDLLGHKDIKQTQIYAHLAPSALEGPIELLEKRLAAA